MHGMCDHPGCAALSTRRPTVLVRARKTPTAKTVGDGMFFQNFQGEDRYQVEYGVALEFCDHHAESWRVRSLIDEACWSAIENQLRQHGLAPPDKDALEVCWQQAAGPIGLSAEEEAKLRIRHGG